MIARVIQFAWLLLALNVIGVAAWVAITDLMQRGRAPIHRGRSWADRPVPRQRCGR